MENRLMFRMIRVPFVLDEFFHTLQPHFHWNHFAYFRLLVVVMAFAWGRRTMASLYRHLDAPHHRTRFNNFFLVARWAPEAALLQKAQELVMALHPRKGETLYLVIDDSKTAKRGIHMDAVAQMKDPVTEGYLQGHQYVCAIVRFRDHVIPYGIRLYVKREHCPALDLPFRTTTGLAAQLIREFEAPAGVKVMGLFDAYSLCRVVVQACRERHFRFASTLKSHRRLFKASWKLKAGRDGRNLCRRRPTATLVRAKPHGQARYRFVDAGWLEVSTRGPLHTVFSRKGTEKRLLGLVTDDPQRSAAGLLQTDEKRWAVEQFLTDRKQLLGLGQYQNRHYRAAVTHRHLVCFASALLTHRRIMRPGAQGQRTCDKAAHWSTAAAQEQRRWLIGGDTVTYLKGEHPGEAVLTALEHLRVA
jgi:DDE superfamily endonuclease